MEILGGRLRLVAMTAGVGIVSASVPVGAFLLLGVALVLLGVSARRWARRGDAPGRDAS